VKPGVPDVGFPVRWRELAPGGPGVYVPADADAILAATSDDEFRATDERMPYFATLWPTGEAMAAEVLAGPDLAGLRVLDLGCGVGAVGIAAARKGGDVAFLDWEPRALALVAASLARQGLAGRCLVADWRAPPSIGRFDRIVAADVLYEPRNLEPVVAFVREHLAPGGEAWIGDPDRAHAAGLVPRLDAAGLRFLDERTSSVPGSPARVRRFRFGRR
jgi:predicted nicotinamide N-methyase